METGNAEKSRGIRLLHLGLVLLLMVLACHWFRSGGISYPLLAAYHLVMLFLAGQFLLGDYGIDLRKGNGPVGKNVLWGVLLGAAAAAALGVIVLCLARLGVGGISVFPWLGEPGCLAQNALYFLQQLWVPVTEEALFRCYFYTVLLGLLHHRKAAACLVSFLFALLHLVNNGIWFQFWVAFGLSLFFSWIRGKKRGNAFLLLTVTHAAYNCVQKLLFLPIGYP